MNLKEIKRMPKTLHVALNDFVHYARLTFLLTTFVTPVVFEDT